VRSSRTTLALGLLTLALGLGVAACGGANEGSSSTTDTTTEQTETDTSTQPTETETETETTTTEKPPPPRPVVFSVNVKNGVPAGGIVRRKADKGDRVVVVVRSDVRDHVHVHGYDLFRDVAPGRPARIAFQATIPGRFEIELEDRHVQIAELTVNP
jgi:hypothetical protein